LDPLSFSIALLQNIAVLAALTLAHAGLVEIDAPLSGTLRGVLRGLLFGAAATATMAVPFVPEPGLLYDMRAIPLALAGPFAGTVGGLVASIPPTLYRIWLGGAGLVPGMVLIFGAALLGILVAGAGRRRDHQRDEPANPETRWPRLLIIAVLLPTIGMACIPLVADPVQRGRVAPLVVLLTALAFPLAIMIFGGSLHLNARRRALAARLVDSERAMATLMANMPCVFFRRRIAADRAVSYPAIAGRLDEVLGLPPSIAGTVPPSIFFAVHPEDRLTLAAAFDLSLRNGTPVAADVRVMATGRRGERWVHVAATGEPERDAVGDLHWDGFVTDITERKCAEIALTDARARLEAMAGTDALTGLANRRRFDAAMAQEWIRAARDGTALSLLVVDVDRFKAYNDRSGHAAGDACLRSLARAVADAGRRPSDVVARIGGDEFALLLPTTGPAGACAIAELLRALVEDQTHVHPDGGMVTVSVGVSTAWPAPGGGGPDTAEALYAAADAALYAAKRAGRNGVCNAGEMRGPPMVVA